MTNTVYEQKLSPELSIESITNNCMKAMKSGEQSRNAAGTGNTMLAPLISFFWGEGSRANKEHVLSVYQSCWPAYVNCLEIFEDSMGQKSAEEVIERALNRFNHTGNAHHNGQIEINAIHIAWYWDLMDEKFDTYYETIRKEVDVPLGCDLRRSVFVFCSQKTKVSRENVQVRLPKVIAWAKEENVGLIILSDTMRGGALNSQGIAENYHIAASVVQMLNSQSGTDTAAASNLMFRLAKNPVWTAAYERSSKNYRDIIYVSLATIIQEYRKMEPSSSGGYMIQSQMQSTSRGYTDWVDKLIERHIYPMLPTEQDVVFWEDLPETVEMRALSNKLCGAAEERKTSFWGRFFGKSEDTSLEQAISSVESFWNLCVQTYYINAAQKFLENVEGSRALNADIEQEITKKYAKNETELIQQEAQKMWKELQDWNYWRAYPKPAAGKSLGEYLHECACVEMKNRISAMMMQKIAKTMDDISKYSVGFSSMLENIEASLVNSVVDENIRNAYARYMQELIGENKSVVAEKIYLCKSEDVLLRQLQDAFTELLKHDQDRIYGATYVEDFRFLKANNQAKMESDIFTSFFSPAIRNRGRLLSFTAEDGMLYCIMNSVTRNELLDLANNQALEMVGTQFVVNRSSEMERIYLYPIEPEQVRY